MKKIVKLVREIGQYYKDYDLHITKNHIEVKFTPHKNSEKEVCFVQSGTDLEDRVEFQFKLTNHLYKL